MPLSTWLMTTNEPSPKLRWIYIYTFCEMIWMMRATPMHRVWDKTYTHAKSIVYWNFLYRLLVHRQNNILPFELCDLIYDVCSEWNHENKGWKSLGAFKILAWRFVHTCYPYMLSTLTHSLTHSFICEIVYLIFYGSHKGWVRHNAIY